MYTFVMVNEFGIRIKHENQTWDQAWGRMQAAMKRKLRSGIYKSDFYRGEHDVKAS